MGLRFYPLTVGFVFIGGLGALTAGAAIIPSPAVTVTDFNHQYSSGGKSTITTRITDSAVLASTTAWSPTPSNSFEWSTEITAPSGYWFVVTPPTGFSGSLRLQSDMKWQDATYTGVDHTVYFGSMSYEFEGLSGTAPLLYGGNSSVGVSGYELGTSVVTTVAQPFSFTGIKVTVTTPFDLSGDPARSYGLVTTGALHADIQGDGTVPDATLISLQPVPEPGTLSLVMLGTIGLLRRRK